MEEEEFSLCTIKDVKEGLVQIPPSMLKDFELADGDKMAVAMVRDRGQIRLIRITADEVYKLKIKTKEIYETVFKVGELLKKAKIKPLHSTGFCYMKEHCIWEGFIEEDKATLDKLAEDVGKIANVLDVEIRRVK